MISYIEINIILTENNFDVVETKLYYLNSRYYDPSIGRFISPDSVDYLDLNSINGLNLYAYCNNDPVNLCDPPGDMPEWARISCIVGASILAVSAVALVAIATGGSAIPALAGAAIGEVVSGSVSVEGQLKSTGTINFGTLMTDMAVGGVSGAFGGSSIGLLGMTISGAGTGFVGSIAGNFVRRTTSYTIDDLVVLHRKPSKKGTVKFYLIHNDKRIATITMFDSNIKLLSKFKNVVDK